MIIIMRIVRSICRLFFIAQQSLCSNTKKGFAPLIKCNWSCTHFFLVFACVLSFFFSFLFFWKSRKMTLLQWLDLSWEPFTIIGFIFKLSSVFCIDNEILWNHQTILFLVCTLFSFPLTESDALYDSFLKRKYELTKNRDLFEPNLLAVGFFFIYIDRFFVSKFQRTNLTVVEINIFYSQTERKGQK